MKQVLDAILDPGSQPADFAALPLPEAYRAVTLHRDEEHMFDGLDPRDRDPRKSLHVEEVPVPELGLGEALIAVMASSVNYNTVWSSIFSPVPTFAFLRRYGRLSPLTARHDLPYHPLEKTGQAALDVHRNLHHGKVAVLCLAPAGGTGVRDHLLREAHLTEINRFRNE
jgi:hypothetical protein